MGDDDFEPKGLQIRAQKLDDLTGPIVRRETRAIPTTPTIGEIFPEDARPTSPTIDTVLPGMTPQTIAPRTPGIKFVVPDSVSDGAPPAGQDADPVALAKDAAKRAEAAADRAEAIVRDQALRLSKQLPAAAEHAPPAAAAPRAERLAEPSAAATRWRLMPYLWATSLTTRDSLLIPAALGAAAALALGVVFVAALAWPQVLESLRGQSLAPLATGAGRRGIGAAVALAAFAVSVWSLKDYVVGGKAFLTDTLARQAGVDAETLKRYPPEALRYYFGILRWAGMIAFVCEAFLQLACFGLVTWGLAVAAPMLTLFTNPADLTPLHAVLFWVQQAFAIVDGPRIFGVTPSPLTANVGAWGFGVAIVFFKVGVFATLVRLFQTSFALRPADISAAWGAALTDGK